MDQGKYEEAEEMNRRALAGREKKLGEDHPDTLASLSFLARLLAILKQYKEAAGLYERVCAGYESRLGASHPTTILYHQHYSTMLLAISQVTVSAGLATTTE
jgi:hypothetical protein